MARNKHFFISANIKEKVFSDELFAEHKETNIKEFFLYKKTIKKSFFSINFKNLINS